jgi:hypothetical protein
MQKIKQLTIIILVIVLSACSAVPTQQKNDQNEAASALQSFFESLHKGDYESAAAIYGGSYDWVATMNPDIDLTDHVALFRNGCANNGFQCLETLKITFDSQPSATEFIFKVLFQNADGSLFVQGPCCGQTEAESPSVSDFKYTVTKTESGQYLVMDMPPYVP